MAPMDGHAKGRRGRGRDDGALAGGRAARDGPPRPCDQGASSRHDRAARRRPLRRSHGPDGSNQDQRIADVASFVRNGFGNASAFVTPTEVARVRASTANRKTPWTVEELTASLPQPLAPETTWQSDRESQSRIGWPGARHSPPARAAWRRLPACGCRWNFHKPSRSLRSNSPQAVVVGAEAAEVVAVAAAVPHLAVAQRRRQRVPPCRCTHTCGAGLTRVMDRRSKRRRHLLDSRARSRCSCLSMARLGSQWQKDREAPAP